MYYFMCAMAPDSQSAEATGDEPRLFSRADEIPERLGTGIGGTGEVSVKSSNKICVVQ